MGNFDFWNVIGWMMVGAAACCIATIIAAATGDFKLGYTVLSDPENWLKTPALIGAIGGFGYSIARG